MHSILTAYFLPHSHSLTEEHNDGAWRKGLHVGCLHYNRSRKERKRPLNASTAPTASPLTAYHVTQRHNTHGRMLVPRALQTAAQGRKAAKYPARCLVSAVNKTVQSSTIEYGKCTGIQDAAPGGAKDYRSVVRAVRCTERWSLSTGAGGGEGGLNRSRESQNREDHFWRSLFACVEH